MHWPKVLLRPIYEWVGESHPTATLIVISLIGALLGAYLFVSAWSAAVKDFKQEKQAASPGEANHKTPRRKRPVAIRAKGVKGLRIEGNVVVGMELLDVSESEDVSILDNLTVENPSPEDKIRAFEAWARSIKEKAGDKTETIKWLTEAREGLQEQWAKLPAEERVRQEQIHSQWEAQVLASVADREATLQWLERVRRSFYKRHNLPTGR